ncbi:hypothetical protein B0H14DRAFT_2587844 [Mycena olivaceomarginata]|nr:hypothetical protein B0H14DRAFT_2587844 [Mycena olivaceomarginata]
MARLIFALVSIVCMFQTLAAPFKAREEALDCDKSNINASLGIDHARHSSVTINIMPLGGRGCVRRAAAEGGRPEVRHGLPQSASLRTIPEPARELRIVLENSHESHLGPCGVFADRVKS